MGMFDDLIPAGASSGPPAGLFDDLVPKAVERGPANQGVFSRLLSDTENVMSAAEQRTTPNIGAQSKNALGEATIDEEGNILIKGQNGQLLPTDTSKHVTLRDPATGKQMVYARSEETNEGPVTGLSRVAMQGMGAGAPANAAVGSARAVNPSVAAAERLDIELPRAVAGGRTGQMVAQGVQNLPFSGNRIAAKVGETVENLGAKRAEVAAGYGSAGAPREAGAVASQGITDWVTGASKANVTKAYDKVDELVNPTVTVPLAKTRSAVSEIASRRSLAALGDSEATAQVAGALERPEGLTYEGIKLLRTRIGEMLDTGILPPNISKQELSRLYGGLSDDLRTAARTAGGGEGLAAFERANRYSRLVSERRESLAKIVGAKGDAAPEQVFDRLAAMASTGSRANLTRLAEARKTMGADDWNNFVSGVVVRMGGEEFSPLKFLTAYNKLDQGAKSILFRSGGLGDLAQHLDDIATVSQKWKQFDKLGNPSGTGRTLFTGGSIVGGLSGMIEPTTLLTGIVGGRILGAALARPATAAAVSQWARAYSRLASQPSTRAMAGFDIATKNLSTNLADKLGVSLSPADVLRAIQGPARAPAEGDQSQAEPAPVEGPRPMGMPWEGQARPNARVEQTFNLLRNQ